MSRLKARGRRACIIRAAKRNVPPLSGGTSLYFIGAGVSVNSRKTARGRQNGGTAASFVQVVGAARNMWTRDARVLRQTRAIL
jgi:hypothetical protein